MLIQDFVTREIFETLRLMEESGAGVTFSELDARLSAGPTNSIA